MKMDTKCRRYNSFFAYWLIFIYFFMSRQNLSTNSIFTYSTSYFACQAYVHNINNIISIDFLFFNIPKIFWNYVQTMSFPVIYEVNFIPSLCTFINLPSNTFLLVTIYSLLVSSFFFFVHLCHLTFRINNYYCF